MPPQSLTYWMSVVIHVRLDRFYPNRRQPIPPTKKVWQRNYEPNRSILGASAFRNLTARKRGLHCIYSRISTASHYVANAGSPF